MSETSPDIRGSLVLPIGFPHRRAYDIPVSHREYLRLAGTIYEVRDSTTDNVCEVTNHETGKKSVINPDWGPKAYDVTKAPPLPSLRNSQKSSAEKVEMAADVVLNHVIKSLRGMAAAELLKAMNYALYEGNFRFSDISFSKMPIGWENVVWDPESDYGKGDEPRHENLREDFFYRLHKCVDVLVIEYLRKYLHVEASYVADNGLTVFINLLDYHKCSFGNAFYDNDNVKTTPTNVSLEFCFVFYDSEIIREDNPDQSPDAPPYLYGGTSSTNLMRSKVFQVHSVQWKE